MSFFCLQGKNPWEDDFLLSQHVIPEVYNLLLFPNLKEGSFSGSVDITLKITAPCDYIKLHQTNLTIESTSLTEADSLISLVKEAFDYKKNEFWIVQLSQTINSGVYSLKLNFTGSLTADIVGFYRSVYKDFLSGEERSVLYSWTILD